MKTISNLSLLLFFILCTAAHAQPVHIPDSNLRAAIADALNIAHDAPITRQDMRRPHTPKCIR